ncbi:TonB-dependent receptor [Pseudomaricurvus alkylphenolicus]|uniref:TonB-dependent receptor plug domain-containing protein n=1 Tax=Pseudomaricurvus alkylphenolicus TaxID=1306991 RepID=UPI0014221F19|nr:TonB-dependent receptor [Pseudomaricurvus alkylphenolicus]NIB40370.1 TonB-dependent receptor [Pseudomaricurvus alkylphenolicus]
MVKSVLVPGLLILGGFGTLGAVEAVSSENATARRDLFALSLGELLEVKVASVTPVTVIQAPSVVSVITAADIEAMGAITLPEVLQTVPGFNVLPSTLNRMNPVFAIRGIYTGQNAQVLFMLNGRRLQSSLYTMSLNKLSHLTLKGVERIEIIRGPGSALHGADAFAGVVNIITHSPGADPGAGAGVILGSNQSRGIWGNWSSLHQTVEYRGYLEYFKRDSDDERVINHDLQSTLDQAFSTTASRTPAILEDRLESLAYGFYIDSPHWALEIDGYHFRDKGVGAGAAQVIDPQGEDDYDRLSASLTYQSETLIPGWPLQLSVSQYFTRDRTKFSLFPPGALIPIGDDGNLFRPHNGEGCISVNIPQQGCVTSFPEGVIGNPGSDDRSTSVDLSISYDHMVDHQWRVALGWRTEELESVETKNFGPGILDRATLGDAPNPFSVDGALTDVEGTEYIYIDDVRRRAGYALVQDIWNVSRHWTLTTGLRYDHFSDFGSTLNPRISLVWQMTPELTSKLLYARAFRAPAFSELEAKNNPVAVGNPSLDAETIDTTELSFSYQKGEQQFYRLSLYHFFADDMIEFVIDPETRGSVAQNALELEGKGLELELSYLPVSEMKLSLSYSYQDTVERNSGVQQPFVPRHKIDAGFRWSFKPKWGLNAQYQTVIDRHRSEGDPRPVLDNYQTLDLTLQNRSLSPWRFNVHLKNILDETYEFPSNGSIPEDYPAHGRRVMFSLAYER